MLLKKYLEVLESELRLFVEKKQWLKGIFFSRVKKIIESCLSDAIKTKYNIKTEILAGLTGFIGI